MKVLITLTTAGLNTGPFDFYSDVDSFASPFETNVTKGELVAGYESDLVPDSATTIRVQSKGVCTNYIDLSILFPTTTTTTSTTSAPTTTTTTTAGPTTTTTSTSTTAAPTTTTTTTGIPQYTYTVYIVDPLTCSYTTPVNMWSFNVITEGYYTYNGGAAVVYIIPSVHVDYTYQITSAIATTCTPVSTSTTTSTTTSAGPTTTTTTTTLQYAYYFEIVNITGDEYTLTLNTEPGLPTTTTNYTLTKTVTTYNPSSDTVVKTSGAGSTVIEKIEKIDYDGTTVLATALVGGTSYTFGTGPFTMNSLGVASGYYQTIRITIANA